MSANSFEFIFGIWGIIYLSFRGLSSPGPQDKK